MGTFSFLNGSMQPTWNQAQGSYQPDVLSAYQMNTGSPQGMDYSEVLAGGQASPVTDGLDYSKIGQWAIQRQQQQSPNWQQALGAATGATSQPTQPTMPSYQPHGGMPHQSGPFGQGQYAGYIGPGMTPNVLPVGGLLRGAR